MRKILVVSHSTFSKGLVEACQMVIGDSVELHYVGLLHGDGIEGFRAKFEEVVPNFIDQDKIIVLADLKGGSPHTASVDILDQRGLLDKSIIITGVNLSLLLTLSFVNDFNDMELINHAIDDSRNSIEIFEVENTSELDEEL